MTFTAIPSVGATGTLNFLDGTTAFCSNVSISTGTATCTTTALTSGIHPITTAYSGDSNYNGANSAALLQVVGKASLGDPGITALTVTSSQNPASAGQRVTFTATVPSGATGTVTFNSDGVVVPGCTTVTISGTTATCGTSLLAPGTHAITAVYSGDSNFNGASSLALSQVVTNPDFALTANNPTYQTVIPGNSVTYSFTFTPGAGNYPCAINFGVTSNPLLPSGYQMIVTPTHLATGANAQAVSLLITTLPVASLVERPSPWPRGGTTVIALILLPVSLARRSRTPMRSRLLLLIVAAVAIASAGCGGGFFGQAPQNYAITLTGTSACGVPTETSHTSTVTLNVQ